MEPANHGSETKRSTYLQILARISPLPVANKLFVGLGATEMTVTTLDESKKSTISDTNRSFCGLVASSVRCL
jgi:hypothetical protein